MISLDLPATRQIAGFVGERLLSRIRPGALLINVGRGGTINEGARVAAPRFGRLAGAAPTGFTLAFAVEDPTGGWTEDSLLVVLDLGRLDVDGGARSDIAAVCLCDGGRGPHARCRTRSAQPAAR